MQASIKQLRVNPAQSRTRISAALLAALAMQMATPDPALALIVKEREEGKFDIISGHRRWLAAMISVVAGIHTLQAMEVAIEDYCDPDDEGWIDLYPGLYDELVGMVEDFEMQVVLWEGSEAEEVLTLLRANLGAEESDLLGLAFTFHAAIKRDVELGSLAQAAGMTESMADAILAIPMLPPVLQSLLNDRLLALEIVTELAELEQVSLDALGRAVQDFVDVEPGMDYTGRIRSALVTMRFETKKAKASENYPQTFNKQRIMNKLFHKAREESPAELAEALATSGLEGLGQNLAKVLVKVPATKQYFNESNYGYAEVNETAGEVLDNTCEGCAFAPLPKTRLIEHLELPCRGKGSLINCTSWVPKGKKFHFRTPWNWQTGSTVTTNFEQLLKLWQGQREYELKEHPEIDGEEDHSSLEMRTLRADIRRFMERQAVPPFTVAHPWATACEQCTHLLEESPVKSAPNAPHCAWGRGRRQLRFQAFWPRDEEGELVKPPDLIIASCLQFAPSVPWADIVPEADTASPFPRGLLEKLIRDLAQGTNTDAHSPHSRGALQFLSGRPELASGNHRKTFGRRFKKEKDELTDRQLWQLVLWLLLDWQRAGLRTRTADLPFGGGVVRDFQIMEFAWAVNMLDEPETEEDEPETE